MELELNSQRIDVTYDENLFKFVVTKTKNNEFH